MAMNRNRPHGTANFYSLPMLFMDLETTGDTMADGGEICEAGLVKVSRDDLSVIGELNLKFQVNNLRGRSEEELSFNHYNGFTFAEWTDALHVPIALEQLNAFAAGCVPWAYNVAFEFKWLTDYFQKYGLDWAGDYHWHCLMTKASEQLRPAFKAGAISKLSLSSIGAFLGLGEEPKPHRGLTGAQYELEVYKKLETI